jgi:hypothetical protein
MRVNAAASPAPASPGDAAAATQIEIALELYSLRLSFTPCCPWQKN